MFEVYTDGGFRHDRNVGAWAFVILENGVITSQKSGKITCSDSNVTELTAACIALGELPPGVSATLFTDSEFVIQYLKICSNEDLYRVMSPLKPHRYRQIMENLREVVRIRIVNTKWVQAHSGDTFNTWCDHQCARQIGRKSKSPSKLRKKRRAYSKSQTQSQVGNRPVTREEIIEKVQRLITKARAKGRIRDRSPTDAEISRLKDLYDAHKTTAERVRALLNARTGAIAAPRNALSLGDIESGHTE